MLVEEGALRRDNGRWIASDLSRITAPATIHALLAARLDRLDAGAARNSGARLVEGQVFHRGAVEFLSPESERLGVEALLSELVLRGTGGARRRQFSATRMRSASTTSCSVTSPTSRCGRRSARLCTSASRRWLDDQAGERASEYDEIVGYHLEQAYRYRPELGA